MSLSDAMENYMARHLFLNEDIPGVGDATGLRGSTAAGNFYAALHSSDPGENSTQSTNEISYTGYGRVPIPRSGAGFTVTGNQAQNASAINFGACTAGTATGAYCSIGVASSGATLQFGSGAVSPSISIANGVTPTVNPLTITFD